MITPSDLIDPRAQEVAARLLKKLGGGAVEVAAESTIYAKITTGSLGLDVILGGGWAVNQWHEIIGQYSAGKTNLALATVAANQRKDPNFTVVWIAAEGWNEEWARSCGVDTNRVILVHSNIMEDAYEAIRQFTDTHAVDLIVIDSYAALVPTLEYEKESGETAPARGALLTNQFFRHIGAPMRRPLVEGERPVTGLFINQWRDKGPGVHFGDSRTTPGGKGKDFAFYTRLDLARDEWIEGGVGKNKERIGQTVRATTLKCKSAPQQRKAYYDIYFDQGGPIPPGQIDYAKEIVTHAVLYEVVEKSGSWLSYKDAKAQGTDNFAEVLRGLPDTMESLEREVLRVAGVA